jgi:hypothetical protein
LIKDNIDCVWDGRFVIERSPDLFAKVSGVFIPVGRQQTRSSPTNRSEAIYRDALAILDTCALDQPVRLHG